MILNIFRSKYPPDGINHGAGSSNYDTCMQTRDELLFSTMQASIPFQEE